MSDEQIDFWLLAFQPYIQPKYGLQVYPRLQVMNKFAEPASRFFTPR